MALSLQQAELNLLEKSVGDYMYYRQPNGDITVAPIGKGELRKFSYMREGWTPLTEYGRFDFPRRYYAEHPFEVLFMRDGAKEMRVEQIVEMGFHFNPPTIPACGLALGEEHNAVTRTGHHVDVCWRRAQPVEFPQLRGLELPGEFTCDMCGHDKIPTQIAMDQHVAVMHAPEKGLTALGKAVTDGTNAALTEAILALATNLSNGGAVTPSALRPLMAGGLPFACGSCGEGFKRVQELSRHVNRAHPTEGDEDGSEAP